MLHDSCLMLHEMQTSSVDVVSDVLQSAELRTRFFGCWKLGAPWAIHVPRKPTSSFYVVARGQARLSLAEGPPSESATGDVVLLPRGAAHVVDDGSSRRPPSFRHRATLDPEALGRGGPLGGDGPQCSLVVGCFSFTDAAHPLLRMLPPCIHLPAERLDRTLAASVSLMREEAALAGPGAPLVLGRLADILLIQVLRTMADEPGAGGWQALRDPHVASALQLLHERFAEPWSVSSLAASVGLSRSGFAARFQERVGESPGRYLIRIRLTHAAAKLRSTDASTESIAQSAGYESVEAFRKAFKRQYAEAPGAYRRRARAQPR